jgi:hypothetical protein
MFLKDETRTPPQKNIRIATSKKLNSGYSTPSAPITGDYWAEGPTTFKLNGNWVVYFDKYRDHKYGAIQSRISSTGPIFQTRFRYRQESGTELFSRSVSQSLKS